MTAGGLSVVGAQVASGIGLAACAGLRAFLPLLVVGVAGRSGWIPLSEPFAWLESTPALVVFGVAVVLEIVADKVPVVDHALDGLQAWVKPVAGTILAASVLVELSPLQATVLGLITGGAVAETVHLTKAGLRLASTTTTAGVANPLLSIAEDLGAAAGSLLAIVVPLLVVLVALVTIVIAWRGVRRFSRRRGATR
ncbi:MAG TPA: DUF4126 domain-containing protein [Candidatus Polarisedimenticolaceae bacterium]|nr:DUF4126 domain-containing protein [Candidatus Polarisedimenticolaceae bacterium]